MDTQHPHFNLSKAYLVTTGYLDDIRRYPHGIVVQIGALHWANENHSCDEVMLHYQITDQDIMQWFSHCEAANSQGKSVILQFAAEYQGFKAAFFDQDHKTHLLHFHIDIKHLYGLYIDNVRQDLTRSPFG